MAFGRDQNPMIGKATQFKKGNRRGGKRSSLKRQLTAMLEAAGELEISNKNIVETKDNGNVVVKLPTDEALAFMLMKLTERSDSIGLKAIQIVLHTVDGKPRQAIAFEAEMPEPFHMGGSYGKGYETAYEQGYDDAKSGLEL